MGSYETNVSFSLDVSGFLGVGAAVLPGEDKAVSASAGERARQAEA